MLEIKGVKAKGVQIFVSDSRMDLAKFDTKYVTIQKVQFGRCLAKNGELYTTCITSKNGHPLGNPIPVRIYIAQGVLCVTHNDCSGNFLLEVDPSEIKVS